jgi:hypothetical protein
MGFFNYFLVTALFSYDILTKVAPYGPRYIAGKVFERED